MALLTLHEVSKSFGGVTAVNRVSLTVDRGEIVGLMGPNGSGKTTLFNLISGALKPDRGEIHFCGTRTNGLPPHRICRRGVARTFQLVRPFLGLTVMENVLVGLGYGCEPLSGWRARHKAAALLDQVGLSGRASRVARTLSVMERKRLELARALATSPKLLLLDEFMAGLTPAETNWALDLARSLRDRGLTLILVEHVVWAMLDVSDRIVVLSAGEKIAEGEPRAVVNDPRVIESYLGGSGAVPQ
ncbi:MAG TPA: ABC transporter ATP-binding protein [Candidatus Binatia bacterium]|nr:ABC transporter ATP-binding protein [Candidatus Binatia bacterium]